jgi:hypothetical protein
MALMKTIHRQNPPYVTSAGKLAIFVPRVSGRAKINIWSVCFHLGTKEPPAPVLTSPVPTSAVPAPSVLTHKVLIRPKPTPCKAPAKMDLSDFCSAMKRLFDAAGFGLNASNAETCPDNVASEDGGTKQTIINIIGWHPLTLTTC